MKGTITMPASNLLARIMAQPETKTEREARKAIVGIPSSELVRSPWTELTSFRSLIDHATIPTLAKFCDAIEATKPVRSGVEEYDSIRDEVERETSAAA
jgi:hypothetical protein